jgi:hypothetical protein
MTRASKHAAQVRRARSPGAGNHRGSIFRVQEDAALINRGDADFLPLTAWLASKRLPDYREASAASWGRSPTTSGVCQCWGPRFAAGFNNPSPDMDVAGWCLHGKG